MARQISWTNNCEAVFFTKDGTSFEQMILKRIEECRSVSLGLLWFLLIAMLGAVKFSHRLMQCYVSIMDEHPNAVVQCSRNGSAARRL